MTTKPEPAALALDGLSDLVPLAVTAIRDILGGDRKQSRNASTRFAAARFVMEAALVRAPTAEASTTHSAANSGSSNVVQLISAEERESLRSMLRAQREAERTR